MVNIRDIWVTIPKTKDSVERCGGANPSPYGECGIRIHANRDWVVIGEYCNNRLCAIKLRRNSNEEIRE
jgi:hypothetical protein